MGKPQKKPFQKEAKEFDEQVVELSRVTRVVKGGRRMRFRATVVIGNKKGTVGFGIGKAQEVQLAISKAVAQARKKLLKVPVYKGTIPHQVQTKFKSSVVFMKPASEGTGLIAGGAVRLILELAGVKNVLSKSLGSTNRINTTKATYNALKKLRERPNMETDQVKVEKKDEGDDASTPEVKKISKESAKSMVHADKKMHTAKKPVKKTDPSEK